MSRKAGAEMEDADGTIGRVKFSTAMPEPRPPNDAPQIERAAPCGPIRDRMLMGLVLITLVRAGEALAGDTPARISDGTVDTEFANLRVVSPSTKTLLANPGIFAVPAPNDAQVFSSTDFRPRKHTVLDADPTVSSVADVPMLHNTTVWQRLSEYKSHDRVQLLTLWQTTGSTVSLQAGKRGDPSLQWTSRLMNHGGSTQGVLDRLFAVSLAHAGSGLRSATRPTNAAAGSKPVSMATAIGSK
jgi:hypothetical protein